MMNNISISYDKVTQAHSLPFLSLLLFSSFLHLWLFCALLLAVELLLLILAFLAEKTSEGLNLILILLNCLAIQVSKERNLIHYKRYHLLYSTYDFLMKPPLS